MRFTAPLLAGLIAVATLGFSGEAEARHRCYKSSHGHSCSTKAYPKRYYSSGYYRYNTPRYGSVYVSRYRPRVTYRYGYGYVYVYRPWYRFYRPYYVPAPAPVYTYTEPQVKQHNTVSSQLELGLRGVAGGTEGSFETVAGLGAYTRIRNGHLGLEASIDSTAVSTVDGSFTYGRVPVLGAAMLYLNPQSPIRLYGLLGGGITFQQAANFTEETLTVQGGAGLDFDLSPRTSLSLDIRALTDLDDTGARPVILPVGSELPSAFVTGNLGISVKF